MQENSGASQILGKRRENELKSGEEERENEEDWSEEQQKGNSLAVTVAAAAVAAAVSAAATSDVCRNSLTANRWPQQETLALLQIRSDMDAMFRDYGVKNPLWEEVSRRMTALGYYRSAKKCKEKFENIYKYHKRLKTSSSARPIGKTYRFFNQLEAFDHHQFSLQSLSPEHIGTSMKETPIAATPISSNPPYIPQRAIPISVNFDSSPITTSTSTPSPSGSESESRRKKKRKWANLFERLMRSVLEKQEELQNKFLEALDKCENERIAREEAWKMMEIERIKQQRELLMQERSISAAKDAAVLAFLQKISEQGNFAGTLGQMEEVSKQELSNVRRKVKEDGENSFARWPKEEVEALIRIKTSMESQYERMGPLWEDISVALKNIGYDRSAKKCKEKWENINKYYRRMKDNNKHKSADSKTCPYFHLLDALYGVKSNRLPNSLENAGSSLRPEELLMHMMNNHAGQQQQPEQVASQQRQAESGMGMELEPSQNGEESHDSEAGNNNVNDGGEHEAVPDDLSPTTV